jgi:hypothetical protein
VTETCEHCHYHEPEGDHLFLKITNVTPAGLPPCFIGFS